MTRTQKVLITLGTIAAFTAPISGCATPPRAETAVLAEYVKPTRPPTFRLVDKRPPGERDTRWLALWTSSCNFGVRQLGDDSTSPNRMELLEQDLNAALGRQIAAQTLIVTHYVIDINVAATWRSSVAAHYPGPMSGAMKRWGAQCSRKQMKGGWYSLDEVTTPHSPVVVDITLIRDGRQYEAHAVQSPNEPVLTELDKSKEGFKPEPGRPVVRAAIFGAIGKATAQLIAELKKG